MWYGLDPKIRTVWMVSSLIAPAVLLVVAVGLALADVPFVPWFIGGLGGFLLAMAVLVPRARWRSWGYRLTDTELMIRFGVLVKVQRWLPRTRIQHVDIVGGPIERALGLRQIVIYTAGTREADVTVPGLRVAVAEQLRSDLLSWVEATGPPAQSDDDVATTPAHPDDELEPVDDVYPFEGEVHAAGAESVPDEPPGA